ncbi:MAG: alpha-amylase family glycosyl hydrolase [Bacteriovoracia bacterium]
MEAFRQKLCGYLDFLYQDCSKDLLKKITDRIDLAKNRLSDIPPRAKLFGNQDNILITYPDQVQNKNQTSLNAQADFCNKKFRDTISAIHILPFYPWSSDDGFSVIDYHEVCSDFGTWKDIKEYPFQMMFDAVFNHISSKSKWFKKFLQDDEHYQDFFIAFDEKPTDEIIAKVTRPRTHPLLTKYQTAKGEKWVWTTFSEDQIDVNYQSPDLLYAMIDALLNYFEKGAQVIRIDAIPFFWKELGTNCSHHPKTHALLKLFRLITDELEKNFLLISESNVPHKENISYFGNGHDEAHLVYNFSLPPLIIHSNIEGNAKTLYEWSQNVCAPSEETTFFNITATHDGLGVRPLEGLVPDKEISKIAEYAQIKGGKVNFKTDEKGNKKPYELNITWTSMLLDNHLSLETNARKIISSHLASYAFPGIPGIYFHNFFATLNWEEGVKESGINRRINRRKFTTQELEDNLSEVPLTRKVFKGLDHGLKMKNSTSAFDPTADKIDLLIDKRIWSFIRHNRITHQAVLVLYNVSNEAFSLKKILENLPENYKKAEGISDILDGTSCNIKELPGLQMNAYQTRWLQFLL